MGMIVKMMMHEVKRAECVELCVYEWRGNCTMLYSPLANIGIMARSRHLLIAH